MRGARERLWQTLGFELLGLAFVTPLFSLATGTGLQQSLRLLMLLSLVVMVWTALYNTVFDVIEARTVGRVASARTAGWRLLHAVGLEVSSVVCSLPVIVASSAMAWREALAADLLLSLVYAAWAYLYHWAYDRLRPVAAT